MAAIKILGETFDLLPWRKTQRLYPFGVPCREHCKLRLLLDMIALSHCTLYVLVAGEYSGEIRLVQGTNRRKARREQQRGRKEYLQCEGKTREESDKVYM